MKYYICLEEDRICYVRGRFKRCAGSGLRRCLEIVEWETCQSDSWTGCQDDELCHSKGGEERYEKNGSQ